MRLATQRKTMKDAIDTSVLIVGAGPVGLALAVELGWRGIDCMVIDQDEGKFLLPRASGISARTMEFCRRWGIVDQVHAAGFPHDFGLDIVFCTSLTGHLVGRDVYPALRDLAPLEFSPENKYRCPQHMFDPVLERAARAYPHVDIRRRCRLDGFVDTGECVLATATVLEEGQTYSFDKDTAEAATEARSNSGPRIAIRARHMVGCDGVNSSVREALGIGVDGNPALSYSISALIDAPGLEMHHAMGDAERYIFIGPEGVWGNLTVVDGRGRWRLTIAGSEEKLDLKQFDMDAAVRRCLGGNDIPYRITLVTPWRRRQMVARKLRKGRVFLAGDAVHAMSPTGGFGMSTGAGDSVDLGWKLEATLRGWGGADLLDSYELERHPVAVRNTAAAADNFKPWKIRLDYSRVLEHSTQATLDRQEIGTALVQAFKPEWETWGTTMGYRYENSPICIPDGSAAYADDSMVYAQSARPGSRAPHAWLEDGRSTLDLFGRGFVLLRFGPATAETERLMAAAAKVKLPLEIVQIDQAAIASLYRKRLVLVRPDGHVAWRGDELPDDAAHLIDLVRGQPAARARPARVAPPNASVHDGRLPAVPSTPA